MYCNACGYSLSDTAEFCPNCLAPVRKRPAAQTAPDARSSGELVTDPPRGEPTGGVVRIPSPVAHGGGLTATAVWTGLSPALRAATMTMAVVFVTQSIITAIPGAGFLLTLPVQIAVYFLQGVLVAKYARQDSRYDYYSPVALAVRTTGWTILFSLLIGVIVGFFESSASFALRLLALPLDLLSGVGTVFICLALTVCGAWTYRQTGGANLVRLGVVILALAAVFSGVIMFTVGAVLIKWIATFYHHVA